MAVLKQTFFAVALAALTTVACSGGDGGGTTTPPAGSPPPTGSAPPPGSPPPPVSSATMLETSDEVARFLLQGSFGGDIEIIQSMVGTDATTWVSDEFRKPCTRFIQDVFAMRDSDGDLSGRPYSNLYWDTLMTADDQLCQRMAFALSQILVISDNALGGDQLAVAHYQDILIRNALGNYRELLSEVTYSPAMAKFLTYFRNRKSDPRRGRMPDENYARELLQLFTIGVVELNMDGTSRLGPLGAEIETFDNTDITGLARVFTGLAYIGDGFRDNSNPDREFQPLQMYDEEHSELDKVFLGTTIPAGTGGDESIERALDAIFDHPNVPPFIARQLIQRFTASNPSPGYVERVATAFANGSYEAPNGVAFGDNRRGDLQATIAAILLDTEALQAANATSELDGKIREPVLKFLQWVRAFNVTGIDADSEGRLRDTSRTNDRLAQHPFRAPSVFNFYRPGFQAPGTESGDAGLTTPEFQIINEGSSLGYINFMTDFVFDRTGGSDDPERYLPDYATEIALANDAQALVAHLNLLLTGNAMTENEISAVENAVSALTISDEDRDLRQRVIVAITLIVSGPAYAVLR
ncbi:MAG: DUF1800 family protein [Pseudomonadota bacterium]